MKRLIYITYLGLLALLLFSCEKDSIVPASQENDNHSANQKTGINCTQYFYETKAGVVTLGNVRSDYAIVRFAGSLTLTQQEAILSQYPVFERTDGNAYFESGMATIIKFVPGANCRQVENFASNLERNPAVEYVITTFNPFGPFSLYNWITPSPEFIVVLTRPQHYNFLVQFARRTKTRIIEKYDDVTYVLAANKYSEDNVLGICSTLNDSPIISQAVPNFYGEFGGARKSLGYAEALTVKQEK